MCEGSRCPASQQSQYLSWQQVALLALKDQQALKRGPLSQVERRANTEQWSWAYEQRGLGYRCPWSNSLSLPGRLTITGLKVCKLGWNDVRSFTEKLLVWNQSCILYSVKLSSIFKHFECPEENHRPHRTSDSSCKMQSMATLYFTVKY